MEKFDIKKSHRNLYEPTERDFVVVEVPATQYIALDGQGDPNVAPDYARAVEALYAVGYALKFQSKKSLGRDFVVAPLEGLWRADTLEDFESGDKGSWRWTMMISQPEWITDAMIADAIGGVTTGKGLPHARLIRRLSLHEGQSVQILHVGPYDNETVLLRRLRLEYLPEHGLAANGDHHEIYLSDPRRTPAEKLKTVLRQPVRPA
ncbi:GyrI-like domain-containing protein [Subtercola endophyticus]|uniref:GyrI-like domain-containing protein n=1 Tax=Subtercola endophyticus TaxID=2895559 RepID=UPI001E3893C0|nr:GyrI-like domain-containing protein [Subtercola endophyticus]UFS60666.1 GyrI-like domain-containing protein [Subtercola endophyticus]